MHKEITIYKRKQLDSEFMGYILKNTRIPELENA
jgi:hypothetical protein